MKKTLLAAALAAVMVFALSAAAGAQDTVAEITIEGNENISEERIREHISTEPGDEYDRDRLRDDMEAVYEMGYFDDVNVSFATGPDGLEAIFEVVEFPRISKIEISGHEDVYTRAEILEEIGVSENEVLNVNTLNSGLSDLNFRFQEDGYIMARIEDVDFTPEGELTLTMNPGYLNEVTFEGNEKTRDYIIERELKGLEPGQPVNQQQIEMATQRLFATEYFQDIDPDLQVVDEVENRANLIIQMEEANTGSLNFGGGYHSEDGWFGFLDVEERNLLGRGQTIAFDWRFGDQTRYNFTFEEPRVMGSHLAFGLDIYDEERGNRVRGVDTRFDHPVTENWDAGLTLTYNRDLDERISTHSVTMRGSRDTRDHPLFPRDGGLNRVSLETAGYVLGGDHDFLKLRSDNRAYFPGYRDDHAVAFRGEIGLSNTELPFHEQYTLGGPDSLRGYSRRRGDNMALLNAEYRFQIIDNVQGAGFYDYGKVWNDDDDTPFLFDLNRGVGAGVRLNTPIGLVRIDYAFDEDWSGTPHLSFGQTF